MAQHELKQDYNTGDSNWDYREADDPRSFERQPEKKKGKEGQDTPFTGVMASERSQSRERSVPLKTKNQPKILLIQNI